MTKEKEQKPKKASLQQMLKDLPVKEVRRDIKQVQKDGVNGFEQTLVQFFPKENIMNIMNAWKEEAKDKKSWLKNFDKHKAEAESAFNKKKKLERKEVESQLGQLKQKITADIKSADDSIKMWEKAL